MQLRELLSPRSLESSLHLQQTFSSLFVILTLRGRFQVNAEISVRLAIFSFYKKKKTSLILKSICIEWTV